MKLTFTKIPTVQPGHPLIRNRNGMPVTGGHTTHSGLGVLRLGAWHTIEPEINYWIYEGTATYTGTNAWRPSPPFWQTACIQDAWANMVAAGHSWVPLTSQGTLFEYPHIGATSFQALGLPVAYREVVGSSKICLYKYIIPAALRNRVLQRLAVWIYGGCEQIQLWEDPDTFVLTPDYDTAATFVYSSNAYVGWRFSLTAPADPQSAFLGSGGSVHTSATFDDLTTLAENAGDVFYYNEALDFDWITWQYGSGYVKCRSDPALRASIETAVKTAMTTAPYSIYVAGFPGNNQYMSPPPGYADGVHQWSEKHAWSSPPSLSVYC